MISVQEALEAILARAEPLSPIEVNFQDAHGRILAQDVRAPEDLPSRPRSAVDGYALRAQAAPTTLRVVGEVTAGRVASQMVESDSAMRIMTGSLLPPGAESVVMVEDTREHGGQVEVRKPVPAGDNVHLAGHDLVRGQPVLTVGTYVGPAEVGMLATVGQTRVAVYPRPRVAVLSTGDELVEPDEALSEGMLRDSNRFALIAAARAAGADVVWQALGADDPGLLDRLVREALNVADVIVTSGGVSMGTRDLIKPLLARLGQVHFGRIAFKPGKPLTFVTVGRKLAFGLPGYPVSSLVTFEVFVRPALLRLQGYRRVQRPRVTAYLQHDLQPDRSRVEYQRAVVRWGGDRLLAASTGGQSSSRLLSMIGANALLELQPGGDPLPAGTPVTALLTGDLAG